MNFFKRLFSNKYKPEPAPLPLPPPVVPVVPPLPDHDFTLQPKDEETFHKQFRPMTNEADAKLLAGAVQMIGNFAMISQKELPHPSILNHPKNLDFALRNGYFDWLKSVGMGDGDIAAQLSFALSEYIIQRYEMILYHDHLPEHRFRMFALVKMVEGKQFSIFPVEFVIKAIDDGKSFLELEELVRTNGT